MEINKLIKNTMNNKLLKFSSPTCGMCREVTKRLDSASIEYTSVDISTDEGMELAQRYGVQHIPAVLLVDSGGIVIERHNTYGEIIEKLIKK